MHVRLLSGTTLATTRPLLNITMDGLAGDDEKKPLDLLGAQNNKDSQPDPDEHIMLRASVLQSHPGLKDGHTSYLLGSSVLNILRT